MHTHRTITTLLTLALTLAACTPSTTPHTTPAPNHRTIEIPRIHRPIATITQPTPTLPPPRAREIRTPTTRTPNPQPTPAPPTIPPGLPPTDCRLHTLPPQSRVDTITKCPQGPTDVRKRQHPQ